MQDNRRYKNLSIKPRGYSRNGSGAASTPRHSPVPADKRVRVRHDILLILPVLIRIGEAEHNLRVALHAGGVRGGAVHHADDPADGRRHVLPAVPVPQQLALDGDGLRRRVPDPLWLVRFL